MPLFRRQKPQTVEENSVEPSPTLPTPPESQGLRSVADHRDYLLSLVDPLAPVGLSALEAYGMAVCEDIMAPSGLPEFDTALVDGYAVASESVDAASPGSPRILAVADWIVSRRLVTLDPDVAVRIEAGCPLPIGADAVVALADTDRGVDTVRISSAPLPGTGVRRQGSQVQVDQQILSMGQRLGAREIGVLAALGYNKILARPRPRVVVVNMGAGWVEPGFGERRGIDRYPVSSFVVAAAAKAEGSQVWRVDASGVDDDAVRNMINDQLIRADLVLITTGSDRPDIDDAISVMDSMGLCEFPAVGMQPACTQGIGLIGVDKVPAVLVAGDAVEAYVTFQTFVRPLIRKLQGATPYEQPATRCFAATILRPEPDRDSFLLGHFSDEGGRRLVRPLGKTYGGVADLTRANCLITLPAGEAPIAAGGAVMVWPLDHD